MNDGKRFFTGSEIVDEFLVDGEVESDFNFIPDAFTDDQEAFTLNLKAILEQQPVTFAIGHEWQLNQVQSLNRVLNTRHGEFGMTSAYKEAVMGVLNKLIVTYRLKQEDEPGFEKESWTGGSIAALLIRPVWQEDAACKSKNDLFFSSHPDDVESAQRICATCPVEEECREYGKGEDFGVWGSINHGNITKTIRNQKRVEMRRAKLAQPNQIS